MSGEDPFEADQPVNYARLHRAQKIYKLLLMDQPLVQVKTNREKLDTTLIKTHTHRLKSLSTPCWFCHKQYKEVNDRYSRVIAMCWETVQW